MVDHPKVAILQWGPPGDVLLGAIFPNATRLHASLTEWGEDVLKRLSGDFDYFAFHIDLTHGAGVPHRRGWLCAELERRGVRLINADATNISKSFVQAACRRLGLNVVQAGRDGDPDERLIVKTNLNYGGGGEAAIAPDVRKMLGIPTPGQAGQQTLRYDIRLRRDVPAETWDEGDAAIERFISNAEDIFYRVYFLFGRLVISRVHDPEPIKKMPNGIARTSWCIDTASRPPAGADEIPHGVLAVAAQVRRFCKGAAFDFGTMDVVADEDGMPFIIDVNTTPYWGNRDLDDLLAFLRGATTRHGRVAATPEAR